VYVVNDVETYPRRRRQDASISQKFSTNTLCGDERRALVGVTVNEEFGQLQHVSVPGDPLYPGPDVGDDLTARHNR
jgi:hypothetical protein